MGGRLGGAREGARTSTSRRSFPGRDDNNARSGAASRCSTARWYDARALSDETEERGGSPAEALRRSPATAGLIAVCVAVFLVTLGHCVRSTADPWAALIASTYGLGECQASLELCGGLSLARVWVDGEAWRIATAGLVHGSWLHLILNIWSLWVVGPWAERCWGPARLLVLFFVSSVVGCLASTAWAEAPLVVGASAGIFGIASALWVVRSIGTEDLKGRVEAVSARALAIMLGAMVALGFLVPIVAQAGHIGGLAAGAWLGWVWSGRVNASMRAVGWAALVAAVLGLWTVARAPTWRPAYHRYVGFRELERGEMEAGVRALERSLEGDPGDAATKNAVAYELAKAGVELDRAQVLVGEALDEEPDNADYLDTLGWIHCRRGDADEGLRHIERASALSEGSIPEIEGHRDACADAAVFHVEQ